MYVSCICTEYTVMVKIISGIFYVWINLFMMIGGLSNGQRHDYIIHVLISDMCQSLSLMIV